MMMILDQIQSGHGGKEKSDLPLGIKQMAVGVGTLLDPLLKPVDGHISACIYCGDAFFFNNEAAVKAKIVQVARKLSPDVILCGPAFNYESYAGMCAILADAIRTGTDIPVMAAMSKENEAVINQYKDKITIVRMPKKGGTGLSQALQHICSIAKIKADGQALDEESKALCY